MGRFGGTERQWTIRTTSSYPLAVRIYCRSLALYSASLSDNLLMGLPEENGYNIDDAIAAAVMEDDLKDLDDGLETIVGPKGLRLSGGQMQRTAAAWMFLRHPELFVFDDLSSALDVETDQKLWARMFECRENE